VFLEFHQHRRAAHFAKAAVRARRRLVEREKLLAVEKAEIGGGDPRPRAEWRAMSPSGTAGNGNARIASRGRQSRIAPRRTGSCRAAPSFGLSADLSDQNARDKLSDALDEEAETLDLPVDFDAALTRLSERGELPSDVFDVVVYESLREVYGDGMKEEHQNILLTVRSSEAEEHFGPSISPDRPALVSLLGRRFPAHPRRAGFYHLVAGERSFRRRVLGHP
jgi:hypothetical protein